MSDPISTPGALTAAQLPADVRAAGAEGRKLYEAALGFEQMLVRNLTAQLAKSAESTDGEEGGDAGSSLMQEQIPDALASSIAANGGLGLAHDLYLSLKREQA
jgi:Rod binding domain-containing protein